MLKSYSELSRLGTFEERLRYLKLHGSVGDDTFGFNRYINQNFYKSAEWRRVRDIVIVRDQGCDLGDPDHPIRGKIFIHHMNPIDENDIKYSSDILLNPEYLICVSKDTHDFIHYGNDIDEYVNVKEPSERKPGDTKLW